MILYVSVLRANNANTAVRVGRYRIRIDELRQCQMLVMCRGAYGSHSCNKSCIEQLTWLTVETFVV
eukprot:SAG31_NODE_2958_length_4852_cov_1.980644_6_plen_66_part_00